MVTWTDSMKAYVRWQVCEDFIESDTPHTLQEALDAVSIWTISASPWVSDLTERLAMVKTAFAGLPMDMLVWELFAGEEEVEPVLAPAVSSVEEPSSSVDVKMETLRVPSMVPPPPPSLPPSPTLKTPPAIPQVPPPPPLLPPSPTPALGPVPIAEVCNCNPLSFGGSVTHQASCNTRVSTAK